ncbi:hypothetical protein K458DRAFT_407137 [Lentithecium fluviatile CBS 122367]|uniref:Uncharacterized protein n=1 Tax=Lentithecium fluviatile CBS 122367 TaxID=1168545 RepID=A0A6G1IR74_9PLEO|nr:hypothetical protein K458DRAFT_407137 [Lentithecium fluviatile CBS 122367]
MTTKSITDSPIEDVLTPMSPAVGDYLALDDALPFMDAQIEANKKIDELETAFRQLKVDSETSDGQRQRGFELAIGQLNHYFEVSTNQLNAYQTKLNEQDRQIEALNKVLTELRSSTEDLQEWKKNTSDWCASLMDVLFGNEGSDKNVLPINALQGWIEESPV